MINRPLTRLRTALQNVPVTAVTEGDEQALYLRSDTDVHCQLIWMATAQCSTKCGGCELQVIPAWLSIAVCTL